MSTLLDSVPAGSHIAIIRLRSLGDSVLTTPALALLKTHRPDLRIGVVVEDRFRAVFEGSPDVDEVLGPNNRVILNWRPTVTLNLHGGTRSMLLTTGSGARIRAGFGHHRYSFVYSHRIPRAQEILGVHSTVHTAEHLASAMFWLGVPHTEIPRAKLVASDIAPNNCAVIHAFASAPSKTWPAERFVDVAEDLRHSGLEPVFLAGPGDDSSPFSRFTVWNSAPLARVKSLMAGAQLFLGNDSGPAHIAAAFGIPSVVLFGTSDPVVWAPWRTEARVLHDPGGIGAIKTEAALDAVHSLKVAA
jgi:ADP-heptose:LPS heptosyltransferase